MECFEKLLEDILNGIYAPGEKLTVSKLKKSLNTGHCPLREALARLVETGLVQLERNRGYRVTDISEEDLRDLIQANCLIDEYSLLKSIEYGKDTWETSVVAALHQVFLVGNREKIDLKHWYESKAAFFRSLFSGYKSANLLKLRNFFYLKLERYRRFIYKDHYDHINIYYEEIEKIANAALKRDTILANKLLFSHYMNRMEWLINYMKKSDIPTKTKHVSAQLWDAP